MSQNTPGTAGLVGWQSEIVKDVNFRSDRSKSSVSTESDTNEVVQESFEQHDANIEDLEKTQRPASQASKRPTLSRVASRLTTHSLAEPPPPPDGGLNAWVQVAMGWLAVISTWGWVNCFGVFQTYYADLLTESASTISWIGTVQTFLTFFIGAFSGRLLDAGYYYPTVLVGVVLQLIGTFTMSLCTTYWQLMLTQGIVTGIGGGILFTPCLGVVATYFSTRRTWAMGVASTGNSAGGLVYPVVVRQLLPQLGFAWTTRILGFINLAFLGTVLAFMRPRLPPRKSAPLIEWSAFREVPYSQFVVAVFFQVWCVYFTLYYVTSFGIDRIGLPFRSSTVLLIIVNGIGVPARLITAILGDKWGQLNIICPIACIVAVVAWSWLAVDSAAGVYVFVCFYGVWVAAFQCLIPPTVAALTDDLKKIGTRFGMVFAVMGLAALTGPPIGGAIVGAQGGRYVGAQSWSAVSSTIAPVVLIWMRMARAKGKWKVKV